MRRTPRVLLFAIAAACWVAAGPGGETTRALLACSHEAMHHAGGQHHSAPSNGPCFCDQMTGGLDLVVSSALPTLVPAFPIVVGLERFVAYQSPLPIPPSPAFSPASPPPNSIG